MSPIVSENATDSSDNTVVVGAGVAGTPSGGVVTIQGILSGKAVPIIIEGSSTASHTLVTPSANVSTQLVAANASRKWLYFVNNSGAPFFIKFGATAVVNQGIQVDSNGGIFTMIATALYLGAINGIVASNARTIEIIEGS